MTQRRTRAEEADAQPAEPPIAPPDSPITMSREEIEEYRAKLRARYHEP